MEDDEREQLFERTRKEKLQELEVLKKRFEYLVKATTNAKPNGFYSNKILPLVIKFELLFKTALYCVEGRSLVSTQVLSRPLIELAIEISYLALVNFSDEKQEAIKRQLEATQAAELFKHRAGNLLHLCSVANEELHNEGKKILYKMLEEAFNENPNFLNNLKIEDESLFKSIESFVSEPDFESKKKYARQILKKTIGVKSRLGKDFHSALQELSPLVIQYRIISDSDFSHSAEHFEAHIRACYNSGHQALHMSTYASDFLSKYEEANNIRTMSTLEDERRAFIGQSCLETILALVMNSLLSSGIIRYDAQVNPDGSFSTADLKFSWHEKYPEPLVLNPETATTI